MIVDLGNTQYNTDANLSEEEFKTTFKGRLNIDLNDAWKKVSKYYRKVNIVEEEVTYKKKKYKDKKSEE